MVPHQAAEERVKWVFLIHLLGYVLVMAVLFYINYTTGPDIMWSFWGGAIWGLGVIGHGAMVLNPASRETMVQRTLASMEQQERMS
jgi:hypothetical protein